MVNHVAQFHFIKVIKVNSFAVINVPFTIPLMVYTSQVGISSQVVWQILSLSNHQSEAIATLRNRQAFQLSIVPFYPKLCISNAKFAQRV